MAAENHTSTAMFAAITISSILLVPLTWAGLSLINTGLNRSRNAAHSILTSLSLAALAMLTYFAFGFALQNVGGQTAHVLNVAGKSWDWLGSGPLFLRGFDLSVSLGPLIFIFQLFTVGIVAIIPVSSGAERWRLGSSCASIALLAGFTYPLFAHWVWGGGWLAQLGANFGLGRGFVDPAGASCIHTVGGMTALSVAWLLGSRRGKFTGEGMPTAMPGHNAVVALSGCMLAFVGWLGLNCSGALLFASASPDQCLLVLINTSLCASAAALSALVVTRVRFGRPDASLTANGWTCGLVASSATSLVVRPAEAVIVGLIAGTIVVFAVEIIELRMKIDDPAGAIAVHAGGGVWGILAVGIFGHFSLSGQFLAQLLGIITLIGFIFPLTYVLNWLLNLVLPLRVVPEAERQGMDLFELGAGAYPEFVTHRDDFIPR